MFAREQHNKEALHLKQTNTLPVESDSISNNNAFETRKGEGNALFVKVNAVVVLTTGVTATSGVLATSADAALTHRCLTTLVAGVLKS